MRLGSFSEFTPSAARRLVRDMGDQTEQLLQLVEADANALKTGVRVMDLKPIRERLEQTLRQTPKEVLDSPLTGEEIMQILNVPQGRQVGESKQMLTQKVLDGDLAPGDKENARRILLEEA
jgi:poly(A) polymerase